MPKLKDLEDGSAFRFVNIKRECEKGRFVKLHGWRAINADTGFIFALLSKNRNDIGLNYNRQVIKLHSNPQELTKVLEKRLIDDCQWFSNAIITDVLEVVYPHFTYEESVDPHRYTVFDEKDRYYYFYSKWDSNGELMIFLSIDELEFRLTRAHLTSEYLESLVTFLRHHLKVSNETV